jgi:peptidylprolyl isomerase
MPRTRKPWFLASVLTGVVLLAACGSDGSSPAADDTTSTTEAVPSAKGKPCVAVAGALPAGAPEVPIQEGPPPTELVIEDLTVGSGAEVTAGSTVVADYIGVSCSSGTIFDSSYSRGEPASFPLDQVIPGWQQGLLGMKVGGTRLLGIPPEMAYGAQSPSPDIQADETLWFVVELRDVQSAATTPPSS